MGWRKKIFSLRYCFNNFRLFNAETYENKEIKKAIITVPTNFENNQRLMTIEQQKKIGLDVIKVINEPTAAEIAYGYIIQSNKERNVWCYYFKN